jgi:phage terminase small subunit
MPPLENSRHERFVQTLFEGKSADEAYALAGYKPHRQTLID